MAHRVWKARRRTQWKGKTPCTVDTNRLGRVTPTVHTCTMEWHMLRPSTLAQEMHTRMDGRERDGMVREEGEAEGEGRARGEGKLKGEEGS